MAINFKRLEEIAKALKPVSQSGKNFHVTFVYNKNKLLCVANNDYRKRHPYHKFGEYLPEIKTDRYIPGIHSECAAIIKMGLEDCSHLTFVNLRIDNNGNPAISKPCNNCSRLLNQIGFKQIIFFDGEKYIKVKHL